jgi:signal transduction histidine kinase/ActR/RegA family two-component response regulator
MNPEFLANSLPHGYLVIDDSYTVQLWNIWLERITGIAAKDIKGTSLLDRFPLDQRKLQLLEIAFNEKHPVVLSQKLHRFFIPIPYPENHISGFKFMQQECYILPIPDSHGLLGISVRDVTSVVIGEQRIKSLKKDLDVAIAAAEQANQAKSDFLAMISHDIRTPMNGVLGFTELLLETPLSTEQRDFLFAVKSSGKMLLTLLNDILDYSKMEAGKMEIVPRPFILEQTVHEIIQLMQPDATEKGLDLDLHFDNSGPECFIGDPVRIQQILINLISNALKFTQKGSVSIGLRTELVGSLSWRLHVAVRDTGIGISPEEQERLFKPFSQVGVDMIRKPKGTGLGLAISKKLCLWMGGDIQLKSVPGEGSEFSFHISLEENTASDAQMSQGEAGHSTQSIHPAKQLVILLADDSPTNRKLANVILTRMGHHVDLVNDGEEALIATTQKAYDLIFMDVQMPKMDGLEATRKIREETTGSPNQRTPICAMTAYAMAEDRERCLIAGMNDYLSKPLQVHQLRTLLAKYAQQH